MPTNTQWRDSIVADIRRRRKLDDSKAVGVSVVSAEVKAVEDDPYLFTATISAGVIDRDDEVLLPSGMMGSEFDDTGAVFWNHNHDQPIAVPVGRVSKTGNQITSKARFMERPADFEGPFLPDYARAFVTAMSKMGKKAGVSVGFIPLENREPSKKDKEMFGDSVWRVISKWKLLEWSIAPVQANPAAMVTAVGKMMEPAAFKALFPDIEPPKAEPKRVQMVVPIDLITPKARPIAPPARKRVVVMLDPIIKAPAPSVNMGQIIHQEIARKKGLIYA